LPSASRVSEADFFTTPRHEEKRKEKERKERKERRERERKKERREERKRRKKKGRRRGQKEEINDSFCMWQLGRANCRLKKRIKLIPP
jgi:hypothetical protein